MGKLTLGDYFTNWCVMQFPNTYRRWLTQERKWEPVSVCDPIEDAATIDGETELHPNCSDYVADVDDVEALIRSSDVLTTDDRQLLFFIEQGYKRRYIAELLGYRNARAVGTALGKIRKKLKLQTQENPDV